MKPLTNLMGDPIQEWTTPIIRYWEKYYTRRAKSARNRERNLAYAEACRVELFARRLAQS